MSGIWSHLLRPHWLVLAVTVLIGVACLFLMNFILVSGELRAQRELNRKTELVAETLNRNIESRFSRVLQLLNSTSEALSSAVLSAELASPLRHLLLQRVALINGLTELAFYDRYGQLKARTASGNLPLSVQPGCLAKALTPVSDGVYLGHPRQGRLLGTANPRNAQQFHIPVCLGVRDVRGGLRGALIAAVDTRYFAQGFESVQHLIDTQVELFSPEGVMLASGPERRTLLGGTFSEMPFLIDQEHVHSAGGYVRDGVIYSYREADGVPLVTVAQQSLESGLTEWRQDAAMIKALFISLAALSVIAGFLLFYSLRRQARMESDIQLLSTAMSTTANSIFITDKKGRIRWVNGAFERLTGWREDEVIGQTPRLFNSGHHDPLFFRELWQTLMAGEVWRGQVKNRNRQGELLLVEQTITPIINRGGRLTHFVAIHEDVTQRSKAEQQARYLARHDQLTGLPNRRFLGEALVKSLEENAEVALVFIDLDRFKTINDTRGHDVGDEMLRAVSDRLEAMAGEFATVARLGGDEFAVLLPGMSAQRLQVRLDAVLQTLAEPYKIAGESYSLTVSVGVAVANEDNSDASTLLRQADLAMFHAKQDGRNTFCFFEAGMDRSLHRHAQLEQGLREALLTGDQLSLRYQPILDAKTLKPMAVEVLTRWQNCQGEWISPAEFIPVAEESDLILEIGRWQLEKLFSLIQHWQGTPLEDLRISVNLSAVQLTRDRIAEFLLDAMQRYQVLPERLVVEITETAIMASREQAQRNLGLIHDAGIQLSIDDFGTGYSSLAYISELNASTLKIDRSFVIGIGHSHNDEEIIETMLGLASNLGISVVAEGVDDPVQLEFLRAAGCEMVQGFMFAKPLTETELAVYMDEALETA